MLAGGDNKHNTQHLSGQQSYSSYCYLDIQVTNSCSISRTMCHFLSFKTHWPFADAEILACLLILSGRYYLLNIRPLPPGYSLLTHPRPSESPSTIALTTRYTALT